MKHYQDLNEINEKEIKFTRDDIFDEVDNIEIGGSFFVLTGTFTSGKRKDIENLIIQYGGKIQKKITKSTDYLVVGEVTTRDWKYGNYGTKIEKALEWRNQTILKIIPEQVLMKSLKEDKEIPHDEFVNELFNIFLNIKPTIKFNLDKQEIIIKDEELSNQLGITIYDMYETFESLQEFLFKKLKAKVKYPMDYIPVIRSAYEQLSDNEKKNIENKLKNQLENYIKTALTFNFKDIKNYINQAKKNETKLRRLSNSIENLSYDFGPFYESKFLQNQIEKFYKDMVKEIKK